MTPQDEERIAEAVRRAEAGTGAELVCVLARASSAYEYVPLVWAALAAFVVPGILIETTLWSAERIYLTQLVTFVLLLLLLSWAPLRMRLVPRAIKRRRAHRAAAEQFMLRRLSRKPSRTGVLIFMSEAERYARVIADEGVARHVAPQAWREAIDLLVAAAGQGRPADGFVAAVELCGRVLAEHVPPGPEQANNFPDGLTMI